MKQGHLETFYTVEHCTLSSMLK